ncbi:MAG: hypothetical protein ACRBBZ_08880 [Nitrosopumilus sp.]
MECVDFPPNAILPLLPSQKAQGSTNILIFLSNESMNAETKKIIAEFDHSLDKLTLNYVALMAINSNTVPKDFKINKITKKENSS